MEAKHTPGPWTYENSGMVDCIYAIGPYGDALRIAEMIGPKAADNAALIAAAPDLLAALKDLRTAVGRMPLAMITEHVPSELADRVNGLLGRLCPPRIEGRHA